MRRAVTNKTIFSIVLIIASNSLGTPACQVRAQGPGQDEILRTVDKLVPTINEVSQKLWDLSEVSLLELKSSAYLKDMLKKK